LLVMLIHPVVKWTRSFRGAIELFEVISLSMFVAALTCSFISPPDVAFLTPLLMIGAFAKESAWIAASRARMHRRAIARPTMLAPLPAG
jgi:hypothetical protein